MKVKKSLILTSVLLSLIYKFSLIHAAQPGTQNPKSPDAYTLFVAAGSQQGPQSSPTIYKIDLSLKKIIDQKSYGSDIATGFAEFGPNFILTTTKISKSKMLIICPEDLGVIMEIPFDAGLLTAIQPKDEGPVWLKGQDAENHNFLKSIETDDKGMPIIKNYKQPDQNFSITTGIAFFNKNNQIYTSLSYKKGGPIVVFDVTTGKMLKQIDTIPEPWMPSCLRISENDRYLFLKLYNSDTRKTKLGILDLANETCLKQLDIPVRGMILSLKGDKLFVFSSGNDGLVKVTVLDTVTLSVLDKITPDDAVDRGRYEGAVVSEDGRYVVVLFSGHGSLGKTRPGYINIVDTLLKDIRYIGLEAGSPVGAIIVDN